MKIPHSARHHIMYEELQLSGTEAKMKRGAFFLGFKYPE
jgi:hypothetical protein